MPVSKRIELQKILEKIICSKHVYYQPPESIKMQYPAIVYKRSAIRTDYANNRPYKDDICYEITLIDKCPDSPFLEKLAYLPKCRFDRHFVVDNLNHDVFTIFY